MSKDYIESNTLIACFMEFRIPETEREGYTPYENFPPDPDPYEGYLPEQMLFHSSFDWLMPVINKIHKLYTTAHTEDFLFLDYPITTPIEKVYKNVVDFIEWYNENPDLENRERK